MQWGIMVELIPEIAKIIGKQPELPFIESRNRFKLLFLDFIKVFADLDHPLLIMLDEVQWSDLASLKLIELILQAVNLLKVEKKKKSWQNLI